MTEIRGQKSEISKVTALGIMVFALCSMLLAPCSSVDAQQTGKIFRIGYLDPSTASGSAVLLEAFRQEMTKLGWIEGKNFTIDYRFAEQKNEERNWTGSGLVMIHKFFVALGIRLLSQDCLDSPRCRKFLSRLGLLVHLSS